MSFTVNMISDKAVYIANAVKRATQGALHLVICDNKKEAYYMVSDLDNFFREENLFFFPATSEKSEYKKNTALLQRTSTLSALTRWTNSPQIDRQSDYVITPQMLQKTLIDSTLIVTYTEAVELLEKNNDKFEYKVYWGCDLQTEHERYLTEEIFKRPVFVTDYPKEIKAFYMKLNDDGKTVAAMDCLVPGIGEIIGGSQREESYEKLKTRIEEMGMKEEDYGFYLDLRKYGTTRHSGFGLGFERMIMYLTGMGNIRDVIPFPRTVNNCDL